MSKMAESLAEVRLEEKKINRTNLEVKIINQRHRKARTVEIEARMLTHNRN